MTFALTWLHTLSVAALAVYGLLGFVTLWLFLRRHAPESEAHFEGTTYLPKVTVQLPIYNEREVVGRLIAAAVALDYPRERLQIQVLDDATDDTTAIAARVVAHYQAQGHDIVLIHRDHREGYKAGALADGLVKATGELIAVFDADFVPGADFLRRVVRYFADDPQLGLVQARWGHLNGDASRLTAAQAVALDKHFVVEQQVRFSCDYYPKFNGSAGVWRRACIEDAGGWQADTVCEDLCLSTRAVLAGWRFRYAGDVVAPAELPESMLAYKNQQARWAMGSTQCLRKYGHAIITDSARPLPGRLYALLTMSAYATHALLILLLITQLPLLLLGARLPAWLLACSLFGLGQPVLFVVAQAVSYRDWRRRLSALPFLLVIAVGLAPASTLAVFKALRGDTFTFTRTPKGNGGSYRLAADRLLWAEIALLFYAALTLAVAASTGSAGSIFLPLLCLLGLGYVAAAGIQETRHSVAARHHAGSAISTNPF